MREREDVHLDRWEGGGNVGWVGGGETVIKNKLYEKIYNFFSIKKF